MEAPMRTNREVHVKVAGWTAACARFTASGEPNAAATVDARRNLDGKRALPFDASTSATHFARRGDDLSFTAALIARALRDELPERRIARGAHHPRTVAAVAGRDQRSRLG